MEANEQVLLHIKNSTKDFTKVISCYSNGSSNGVTQIVTSNGSEIPQVTEVKHAIHQQWRAVNTTPEDPSKVKVMS